MDIFEGFLKKNYMYRLCINWPYVNRKTSPHV